MTTTIAGTQISLGTTLYSFTNEWVARKFDLEQIVKEVAGRGIGPGVEIVGFQSIRNYPHVDDSFVNFWRGLLDTYGLVGTSLGSNIDVALRPDRFLNTDEMLDYLAVQIEAARRLQFPILRIQMGATPEVLELAAPIAERAGVTLGMEIHAPEGALTPAVVRVRELYDRLQSERLGFIPDFSSTMRAIPPGFVDLGARAGIPQKQLATLQEIWAQDGLPHERYATWSEGAQAAGVDADAIAEMQLAFAMFGHETVESWAEILPQTVHVHGKFYSFENGIEPSIDYEKAIRVLVEGGYSGSISSEWEGHTFTEVDDVDVAALIKQHHELETAVITSVAEAARS
ncbi:sugar phosphate isomerase/epimerase family protein [Microbacterium sp. 22215]|uniref:sugar phosphate isomerase/epimerase family protein n=1 Tax=Microbacterium sp. 22215 TaxID=3453893 RepID=UPI003F852E8D